jgi:hypothetical protein
VSDEACELITCDQVRPRDVPHASAMSDSDGCIRKVVGPGRRRDLVFRNRNSFASLKSADYSEHKVLSWRSFTSEDTRCSNNRLTGVQYMLFDLGLMSAIHRQGVHRIRFGIRPVLAVEDIVRRKENESNLPLDGGSQGNKGRDDIRGSGLALVLLTPVDVRFCRRKIDDLGIDLPEKVLELEVVCGVEVT